MERICALTSLQRQVIFWHFHGFGFESVRPGRRPILLRSLIFASSAPAISERRRLFENIDEASVAVGSNGPEFGRHGKSRNVKLPGAVQSTLDR
jgi:hypothetical protein